MTTLTAQFEHYLAVRRSLGYDLSFSARVLCRFTEFADAEGTDHITVDLFLRWKDHFGKANNNTWAARLGMVRTLATWLQGIDPRTEVPPAGLISHRFHRSRPYIYTDQQVAHIVEEAGRLPSSYGLRGWTYSTLFGVIAATGLRISEALALNEEDVDLDEAVLTVRRGKNGKSRFVPVTACVVDRLRAYRHERNRLLGAKGSAFLLIENGVRLTDCGARYNFAQVCQRIGLRQPQKFGKHGHGPRIHDLRHYAGSRTMPSRSGRTLDFSAVSTGRIRHSLS